jgi:hypothetical protein
MEEWMSAPDLKNRRRNLRRLVQEFGEELAARRADHASGIESKEDRQQMLQRVAKKVQRPLTLLFHTAGLDIEKDGDWKLLLTMLAAGMYSSDREGRPKDWTKRRLRRLREIFDEKKKRNPQLTQAAIAKEIIKESLNPDIKPIKPSTLLRRLPRKPRRPRP